MLQSEEIRKHNQSILDSKGSSIGSRGSVYLNKWSDGDFLPIGSKPYYGGDQGWLSYGSVNGCGPTAASNILAYLATENASKYGRLYPYGLSIGEYSNRMEKVYSFMQPINGVAGVTSISDFASYVENYARVKCSTYISGKSIIAFRAPEYYTINFIKMGLSTNSPIASLNLHPPGGGTFPWHWVTITAFHDYGSFSNQITLSTWGKKKTVNYHVYYSDLFTHGGGYVYFN